MARTRSAVILEYMKWPDRSRGKVPTELAAADRFGSWLWSPPQPRDPETDYDSHLTLIPAYDWWTATWILLGGEVIKLYVNLTTPANWVASDHVTMVDLEIDVQRFPDGRVEVLDEDEFASRAVEWSYPPVIRAVVPLMGQTLAARLTTRDEPFAAVAESHLAALVS